MFLVSLRRKTKLLVCVPSDNQNSAQCKDSRGGLSVTDTAVNRESGWVGFVDIIMRLAKSSGSPTQPARLWWGERRQWLSTADVVGGYCNYLPNARRLLTLANRLSEI